MSRLAPLAWCVAAALIGGCSSAAPEARRSPYAIVAFASEPRAVFETHVRGGLTAVDNRLADVERRLVHLGGERRRVVEARALDLERRRQDLFASASAAVRVSMLDWPAARGSVLAALSDLERDAAALGADLERPPPIDAAESRPGFSPFW